MSQEKSNILDLGYIMKPCFDAFQEIGNQTPDVRQFILRKLISNLEAINILLINQCTHEIKIILRSAIESVVLFIYLTAFPNRIAEYKLASEISELKSAFIVFKNFLNDYNKGQETLEECERIKKLVEDCFEKSLSEEAKNYLLKKLSLSQFCINETNIEALENFFRNDDILKKAFFCKIERMFTEIPLISGYNVTLREIFYYDYNNYSQITHGQLLKWVQDIQISHSFVQEIRRVIHSIIVMPIIYAEKNGIVLNNVNKQNLYAALKKLLIDNY